MPCVLIFKIGVNQQSHIFGFINIKIVVSPDSLKSLDSYGKFLQLLHVIFLFSWLGKNYPKIVF